MKPIYSVLLILFLSNPILESQEWIAQYPFSAFGSIEDIQFDASGYGYAVGENGILLSSENYGEVWVVRQAPFKININIVEIIPGSAGQVALAAGQQLYRTEDGGKTWERPEPSMTNVEGIQSYNESIVYIASSQNGIYKSEDAGQSYTRLNADALFFNDVHFVTEMKGFASIRKEDGAGALIMTEDGGNNWVEQDSICDFLGRVEFVDENIGYLKASCGLFKTTDGGMSWNLIDDGSNNNSDFGVYGENIWLIGGKYQYSTDGGMSWTETENPGRFNGSDIGIFMQDENTIWITGAFSGIFKTTDQGQTWTNQIPGTRATIYDVLFTDKNTGFAIGEVDQDVLLVTKNGGAIWEEKNIGNKFVSDLDVYNNSLLITTRSGAYITKDEGETKIDIPIYADVGVVSGEYIDDENIILGLNALSIVKTNISGTNQYTVLETSDQAADIDFYNTSIGWAVTEDGKIYHSSDGGESWTEQYTDDDGQKLTSVTILDENNVFATIERGDYFLKTVDGGSNWEKVTLPGTTFWRDMTFMDENTGWLAGGTRIYITTDGGNSWEVDYEAPTTIYSLSAPVPGTKLVWASGNGGFIGKFSECNAAPELTNLRSENAVCVSDTISMEVDFADVDIFDWTIPNDWKIVGNDNSARIEVVIGSDLGEITVIGSNSCGDQSQMLTFDITEIGDKPPVNISVDENILSADVDAISYQWYLDGQPITNATEKTFEATTTGDYYVTATYQNGCMSDPSNTMNVVISSIVNLDGQEIKVYPNPATHLITIEGLQGNIQSIQLFDLTGKLVRNFASNASAYDLAGINAGLYLLKIQTDHQTALMRIVKE